MKKQFIIFLSLGLTLLTIGSVGAGTLFSKVEKEMKVVVDKSYSPKSQEALDHVTLTVDGHGEFLIMPSEDENFHLQNTFYNVQNKRELDWTVSEKDKDLTIGVKLSQLAQKTPSLSLINLNLWDEWTTTLVTVPKNIKKLTIKSQTHRGVNISALDVEDLTLDVAHHVSVDTIEAQTMSTANQDSSISVSNSNIKDKITLNSKHGDLSVQQTQFKDLSLNTDSGTLTLDKLIGNAVATSNYGQVYINQVRGETNITNQNGGVEWNPFGTTSPLTITTKTGTITANLQNNQDNFDLTVDSTNGTIYKDGEIQKSLHYGKGKVPVKLNADNGTINVNVNTYFDHEDMANDFNEEWD